MSYDSRQMGKPTYTETFRRQVAEHAGEHGTTEAAKHYDVPKGTVSKWCSKFGIETTASERMKAANEARRVQWEERRTVMVHQIGSVADLALDKATEAINDGHARNAKDFATTMAILIDKAQLLSGGVTSRMAYGREQVEADMDELAVRRKQRAA